MVDLYRVRAPMTPTNVEPFLTRIEPNPVSGDPQVGLMAEVWDPLWMIGRQWQIGEFAGEDTGTPLALTVSAEFDPLVAWHAGPFGADAAWRPLEPGELLEPLVEGEAPAPAARLRAGAAWALQDALADFGETRAVDALLARCAAVRDAPPPGTLPTEWDGMSGVLAQRALDPDLVAAAFAEGTPAWFTTALRPGTARRRRALTVVNEWRAWFAAEVSAEETASSWLGDRLEYEFAVATTESVLHAPAHGGGEIGWASFDLDPARTPPPTERAKEPLERHVLASQLAFAGMPASRFWEFEDSAIDLGQVWADPHELARVLVVEAAIVSGDDWVVVPVDAPPGGILRVTDVTWVDTFGTEWHCDERLTAVPAGRFSAPWRLFTVTGSARDAGGPADGRPEVRGILIPPVAASALEAPPIEDVRFLRDETANLVWAIEETVATRAGDPRSVTSSPPPPPANITAGGQPANEVLGYELATWVPTNWFPYVAVVSPEDEDLTLVRADLDRGAATVQPAGLLLSEEAQRAIRAREVPRQGVRVQRIPRAARRADGAWRLWTARQVRPGAGEGESGMRFDHTRRPGPPTEG